MVRTLQKLFYQLEEQLGFFFVVGPHFSRAQGIFFRVCEASGVLVFFRFFLIITPKFPTSRVVCRGKKNRGSYSVYGRMVGRALFCSIRLFDSIGFSWRHINISVPPVRRLPDPGAQGPRRLERWAAIITLLRRTVIIIVIIIMHRVEWFPRSLDPSTVTVYPCNNMTYRRHKKNTHIRVYTRYSYTCMNTYARVCVRLHFHPRRLTDARFFGQK